MNGLSRNRKRSIVLGTDAFLAAFSFYLALTLRYGTWDIFSFVTHLWPMLGLFVLLGAGFSFFSGLYQVKLHVFDNNAMLRLGGVAVALGLSTILLSHALGSNAPRSVPFVMAAVFFVSAAALRVGGLALLHFLRNRGSDRARVAIYGAGAAGTQLAVALRNSTEVRPVVFVDQNPALRGTLISGLKVILPAALPEAIEKQRISKILLAIPSLSREGQKALLGKLSGLGVEVQLLPSFVDMIAGRAMVEAMRPVAPDALLGRDKVDLDIPDVAKAYAGRVVMVTGAGGSIGSELCRQLVGCAPARIVLFEQSEFNLYQIDKSLRPMAEAAGIPVTTRLGSVTNPARVANVMADEGVEIVLHAAAYKHVPIVEENELEGGRNNVLGTQIVAEAAISAGVERFILVSTDKAVRPTNIMGASKRMAELVIQDLQTRSPVTKLAIVRFGNVLGSSGSVLPLFQQQIRAGGPVTVTHAEVTRFFMTIPEASRLVLLAGAYATGGDVFVLDMGAPVRIMDIARRMIELSGLRVREGAEGDIEIRVTGLRPGEKLYEELLIDDDSLRPTPHEKILRAQESMLSQIEVAAMLKDLHEALAAGDRDALRHLVRQRVEGYHTPSLAQQEPAITRGTG